MGWDNVADRVTAEMSSGGSSYDVIEFDNAWVAKCAENRNASAPSSGAQFFLIPAYLALS